MKTYLSITVVILMALSVFSYPFTGLAQNDSQAKIDDILEGFEDKAPARDDLENLTNGFEDEAVDNVKAPLERDATIEGLDEETPEETRPSSDEKKAPSWSLEGEFAFTTIYNFSPDANSPWRGFSMLRPELELTLKNRFSDKWQGQISARSFYDAIYALQGRDEYTSQVLDEYEMEFELQDTYIQGSITDHLDTKIGRQIVVWGTLDNLRVTDVLNPLDLRVPGLTDIEDLRLPVTMAKFDYYFGNWDLSGMVIPEVRFSKRPVFGSDFYPAPIPPSPEDKPDNGFANAQYAAALTGVFSGWDIGFYWADIYSDQTYTEPVSSGLTEQFVRRHARISMLGTAANYATGNWLLKAEVAWFDGLQYTNTPGVEKNRLDVGGGVEYSGFTEATVSLEAANRHIFDYDSHLELPPDEICENEFQWSLRVTKDFLNDTLTLTLLASTFGIKADDGAFERLEAEYDITDSISIKGGVVFYQSGDKGFFQSVDANDRLFAQLKYSF
jgi:hypothetical protein